MTSAHRARENSGCKEAAGVFAVCAGALISGGLLQRELLGGLGVPGSPEKQRRSARWWPRRGQPWGCLPPARALEGRAAKSRLLSAPLSCCCFRETGFVPTFSLQAKENAGRKILFESGH